MSSSTPFSKSERTLIRCKASANGVNNRDPQTNGSFEIKWGASSRTGSVKEIAITRAALSTSGAQKQLPVSDTTHRPQIPNLKSDTPGKIYSSHLPQKIAEILSIFQQKSRRPPFRRPRRLPPCRAPAHSPPSRHQVPPKLSQRRRKLRATTEVQRPRLNTEYYLAFLVNRVIEAAPADCSYTKIFGAARDGRLIALLTDRYHPESLHHFAAACTTLH